MISLLTNRLVIGGAVIVAMALALWVQTERLDSAREAEAAAVKIGEQWRANFEGMEAVNAANVRAIEKLQAEAKRIEGEAIVAREANEVLSRKYQTLRKALKNAPNDRPVSPLLCGTFDELRKIDGADGTACRH